MQLSLTEPQEEEGVVDDVEVNALEVKTSTVVVVDDKVETSTVVISLVVVVEVGD